MRNTASLYNQLVSKRNNITRGVKIVAALSAASLVAGCQGGIDDAFSKAEKPVPERLVKKMKAKDMTTSSPIALRIFKSENIIEVWKKKRSGRYDLLDTYEICKWSGKLGPKFKEGDRQAPEGFYSVGKAQMNPFSSYHLSFNIGFPNVYDRAHGRTGTNLMVHGACSSAGCYSMTDERVEEIYALARDAFKGGQKAFQVQAFPFRMTAENMAKHASHPQFEFWKMLKEGYDHFEITKVPPKVNVCEKRYIFNRVAEDENLFSARAECPEVTMPGSILSAYASHREKEQDIFSKVLKKQVARAKVKGSPLSLPLENMTIVAKGSEILPPPTPKPKPKPVEVPVPQAAPVIVAKSDTLPGVETGTGIQNAADNAALQQNNAAQNAAAKSDVAAQQNSVKIAAAPVPAPAPAQVSNGEILAPTPTAEQSGAADPQAANTATDISAAQSNAVIAQAPQQTGNRNSAEILPQLPVGDAAPIPTPAPLN